jgi:succinate dehydrogenase / fumarate reductase iron-sulfur subunit
MSFLEMLDVLNERLINEGEEPIAFDHDCREGICGTCSLMINGQAHGPQKGTGHLPAAHAQVPDGDEIVIEPWRAAAFPIVKDLMVDRGALRPHRGGRRLHHRQHRLRARRQPPSRSPRWPTPRWTPPPASAAAPAWRLPQLGRQLFTSAKVAHLNLLPQGQAERYSRVEAMVDTDGGVLRLLHQPRRVPKRARRRSRSTSSP